MYKSIDVVELFIGIVNGLKQNRFNLNSPLDEIVLRTSKTNLAYVDDRGKAKEQYGFDFWANIKKQCEDREEDFTAWMRTQGIDKRYLYSSSQQFPDFLFKVRERGGKLAYGSLLELKDSKGGTIASFNSTIPTKYKSLGEVDMINGKNIVSRIASIMDGGLASDVSYHNFHRRNFYLVRTYRDNYRVKVSIIDGSFFETVPKDHLIYQMFLNILRGHLNKEDVEIPIDIISQIEKAFYYITDQTIIASSQSIEGASVRPRLRIMAEVHAEGNPHSSFYPEIPENSFNLILEESTYEEEIEKMISEKVADARIFVIRHKRNGKHIVFQFLKNKSI